MLSQLDLVIFLVDIHFELVVSSEILEGLDEVTDWGSNGHLEI